jgi:site-specific DNA-methyltransferase (adenine-specific)
MAMCEYAWTSFNENAKWFECAPQGTKAEPRIHPTQKPVKLYEWILANYAKEGDIILDTHAGSGSCLIAAHRMGLNYIGYEIDDVYYGAAQERIEAEKMQLRLF